MKQKFLTVLSHQRGFTLIELLIVTTLSIMLMLTAGALFTTILLSSNRTDVNQTIKAEGEYALAQMEYLLRNAIEIRPNSLGQTCTAGMTEITFRGVDEGVTTLTGVQDAQGVPRIASNSAQLTSDSVELVSGPVFDCTQTNDLTQQYVTVSFTLSRPATTFGATPTEIQQTFTTGVNLRSL